MGEDRERGEPSSSVPEESASSEAPRAGLPCAGNSFHGGASETAGRPPTELTGGTWQPGVVHVEFKDAFPPDWLRGEPHPPGPPDVAAVREMLKKYEPWEVALTFADDTAEKREELDRDRFFTFQFHLHFEVTRIAADFRSLPKVIHAAPEPRIAPPSLPEDPLVDDGGQPFGKVLRENRVHNQWYLFRCHVDDAWVNHKVSGKGVVIADIDWGFFLKHEDLRDRVTDEYNAIEAHCQCTVDQGGELHHGTAALGIAGAENNGRGIAGFAYEATLWAVRAGISFPNQECSIGSAMDWAKAITHVCDKQSDEPKVIMLEAQTCSGRNIEGAIPINKAIKDAIEKRNVVVCVAAGNGGHPADRDDANGLIPETGSILVGATEYHDDPDKIERGESNHGSRVVVSAPGSVPFDVTCCSCGSNRYRNRFGGTSGALAKVAGTVALMLEANKSLTHVEVRDILSTCGQPIMSDKPIGRFLNAEEAVREAVKRGRQRARSRFFRTLMSIAESFRASLRGSRI